MNNLTCYISIIIECALFHLYSVIIDLKFQRMYISHCDKNISIYTGSVFIVF